MIKIREELPSDRDAIEMLTIEAFEGCEFGHNGEATLIHDLRTSSSYLSVVACTDDQVVGHAFFSPVTIQSSESEAVGMGLAPMSVLPSYQRTGVGARLVGFAVERLFATEVPFLVVLGHPDYYPRFGFQPASDFGVTHGFAGIPQDVFFVQFNPNCPLQEDRRGRAFYGQAFGMQYVDV